MYLDQLPIPMHPDAEFLCDQELSIDISPLIIPCEGLAVGMVPATLAEGLSLPGRLICQEHADELENELLEPEER